MKFLKNRTVLGLVCIAAALVLCFLITPMFNASLSKTVKIVRAAADIKAGQKITSGDIEITEVGAYNLPSEVLKASGEAAGKYAVYDILKGDYFLPEKVSDSPASENIYLYNLDGVKRAVSVTIPSFAGGLSGKLISGDIVSIIAVDYREKGETLVPDELQYVEVIAVTDENGNDETTVTVTPDGEEEKELPATVTLLANPVQANILAELDSEGQIHISLVYRGSVENAKKFTDAQDALLDELEKKKQEEQKKKEELEQEKAEQESLKKDENLIPEKVEKPEKTEETEESDGEAV